MHVFLFLVKYLLSVRFHGFVVIIVVSHFVAVLWSIYESFSIGWQNLRTECTLQQLKLSPRSQRQTSFRPESPTHATYFIGQESWPALL